MKASEEMKKAASWAGAPHDMAKMMSDPKLAEASKKMVEIHKEIIAMFQKSLAEMEAQHKAMK
jgi:HD superfamily phosphohydrolase YqeK